MDDFVFLQENESFNYLNRIIPNLVSWEPYESRRFEMLKQICV